MMTFDTPCDPRLGSAALGIFIKCLKEVHFDPLSSNDRTRSYPGVETVVDAQNGRFSVADTLSTMVKKRDKDSDLGTCMAYGSCYSRAV